jgi:biopolymer transport protein ExbB
MKWTTQWLASALLLVALNGLAASAAAQDMREAQIQARETRKALIDRAAEEQRAAEQAAARSREKIGQDRTALKKALAALEARHKSVDQEVNRITAEMERLTTEEKELTRKLTESDGMVRELVGVIRVNAKDLVALIEQNLQSALIDTDIAFLQSISGQARFPGMDDIRRMVSLLFQTIQTSGEVSLQRGTIVDRAGLQVEADILALGNFTAAYRIDGEVGYLTYAPASGNLYALSRLPGRRVQRQLAGYMDGSSQAVPMDVSRGGALRQLTHELSLWQQIPKGGIIVWPILAILAVGIAIIIERVVFLWRKRMDGDRLMNGIAARVVEQKWDLCHKLCEAARSKPIARVVAAGLNCRKMAREEMENALQEAILREIPPMERFLSTLGMLAAIAPLLGLLGTVTGMIDTFHVITQHGTGDPRMMSGGISEALVTTMLGLTVAIPIMLAHTLLNRSVDNRIGQMEEKAVALVNIVHKNKERRKV